MGAAGTFPLGLCGLRAHCSHPCSGHWAAGQVQPRCMLVSPVSPPGGHGEPEAIPSHPSPMRLPPGSSPRSPAATGGAGSPPAHSSRPSAPPAQPRQLGPQTLPDSDPGAQIEPPWGHGDRRRGPAESGREPALAIGRQSSPEQPPGTQQAPAHCLRTWTPSAHGVSRTRARGWHRVEWRRASQGAQDSPVRGPVPACHPPARDAVRVFLLGALARGM